MAMHPRQLNIGCGQVLHPEWLNADFRERPGVVAVDARRPLPFEDAVFDAVYHSHMLEHLSRDDALRFISECRRVLAPGGVLRIVVPDFGSVVDAYLDVRQRMENGASELGFRQAEWLFLELIDQFARDTPGGEMACYLAGEIDPSLHEFLGQRVGYRPSVAGKRGATGPSRREGLLWLLRKFRPSNLREHILKRLLGRDDFAALCVGRFRKSGEMHRWLYDRHTLAWILYREGFQTVHTHTAESSAIPGWERFRFDLDGEGRARKPSSLYIEAQK
jgi:SAM-dependent methyltransferase